MPCQMIVNVLPNGKNPEGMKKYMAEGPAILAKYGGKHVAMGGNPQVLEGDFKFPWVVVSEWPTREAALAFWNSPEYTELRKYREGTGEYQILVIDTK